ncbi:hypothetical protein ACOME3_009508 [Neoechinorhynchus agilis]
MIDLLNLKHSFISSADAYKRLALVVVCVALLLDNMIYMVIVPIIPMYFNPGNENSTHDHSQAYDMASNDISIGILFAFKAIVQLIAGPISGTLIDKYGYRHPMVTGLVALILSTIVFAYGRSYSVLIFARGMQGIGSAFADTAAFSLIADVYVEDHERNAALGIALAFVSFGTLAAPPFGGVLFDLFGKNIPFFALSSMAFIDLIMFIFLITSRIPSAINREFSNVEGTPIFRLMLDPFVAICAGALSMSNVSLAFLETTIGSWMRDKLNAKSWQIGFIWFPAILPHWIGVYLTVWLCKYHGTLVWAFAMAGLFLEAFSCIFIPFCGSYWSLIVPISAICFGIAIIDTALLPTMAFLVDTRHTSVYGSIYAIVDISYNVAYAFGPVIAGSVVTSIGFTSLNIVICIVTAVYAPILRRLRDVCTYKCIDEANNEDAVRDLSV